MTAWRIDASALGAAGTLRNIYRTYERAILGLSGFAITLVAWELAVEARLLRRLFVGSPSGIWEALTEAVASGSIWKDVGPSLTTFVVGYTAAVVIGMILGFIVGWYRRANQLFDPWISALYATPDIALVPLIILWLGIGLATNAFIVFLAAVFSVTVNVLVGVRSVESNHLQVARSFNATQSQIIRTLVLPTALPFLLAGMRLALGRALVGVVVAEFIASNQGIGFMMSVAGTTLNTDRLMLGLLLLGTFGMVLGEVLRRIELRFEAWRPRTGVA